MIQRVMTANEFAEKRSELPDAGQWAELIRGVPVTLQPPDIEHGTIVLNLSKSFARYVHSELNGYPCFDLGLQVESKPDTVLFPAVSYFTTGERFAESDRDFTETVPAVVVELATSRDRRTGLSERAALYHQRGVSCVWIIDSNAQTVHVLRRTASGAMCLSDKETLHGGPELRNYRIPVAELFVEPEWA